jgi:hypothetical protein
MGLPPYGQMSENHCTEMWIVLSTQVDGISSISTDLSRDCGPWSVELNLDAESAGFIE